MVSFQIISLFFKKEKPERSAIETFCKLVWLFFLYVIQGLVCGYFGPCVEILLIERGASYDQLAIFTLW
jgi:hypothetical protein